MPLTVNLDGVEANNVVGLPPGEHLVKITAAVPTISNSGTEGLKVTFIDQQGRMAWDRVWITEKALGILRAKLEAAGYPIPSGEFDIEAGALVGQKVTIGLSEEEYGGRTRTRVDWWRAVPGQPAAVVKKTAAPTSDDEIPF